MTAISGKNYVGYLRVSTQRQGQSGLGLEAQRMAVQAFAQHRGGAYTAEFHEIESGRKRFKQRVELERALAYCRQNRCELVIGKLDRLARDVRFFLEVIDTSKVKICFADLPDVDPASPEGRMILVSMANFAEFEGRRISERTRSALAAAKARGVVLGAAGAANLCALNTSRKEASDAFSERLRGVITGFKSQGMSQRKMVAELNGLGLKAPRGGIWSLRQLQLLIARLGIAAPGDVRKPEVTSLP